MIRKLFLTTVVVCLSTMIVRSQSFVRLSDLFERADGNSKSGQLNIIQDPALDTLINRYILANEIQEEKTITQVLRDSEYRSITVPTEMLKQNQVKSNKNL